MSIHFTSKCIVLIGKNLTSNFNLLVLVSSIGNDKLKWHFLTVPCSSTLQSNGGGSLSSRQRNANRHDCGEESGVLSSIYLFEICKMYNN